MATNYTVKEGDTLNAIASKYGFKSYKDAGITGYKSGNPDLIRAGEVLTIGKVPSTPATVSKDNASQYINGKQDEDIASAPDPDAAPSRGDKDKKKSYTSSIVDAYEEVSTAFAPKSKAPKAPSYMDMFEDLRKDYGLKGLEDGLTDLESEEAELVARRRQRTTDEQGKPVAMNVISGRIGEVERQEGERLDYIGRQKAVLVNQINSATATIENVMNFTKMDYDTAKSNYDSEFSQNLQMFNVVKGIVDTERTETERLEDNARANLNIIYGAMKDGGIDVATIDASTKTKITKMELEAGLPSGFYAMIAAQNPEGKILSTTTRTTSGAKYADILTRNADGSIVSKSVYLGATNEGSSTDRETDSEQKRRAIKTMAGDLNSVAGGDGYVSNEDFRAGRQNWISAGFDGSDFDSAFKAYANPDHLYDYGLE